MRRQTRPYTVEVKNKRRVQSRNASIWGDLDLAAVAREAALSPDVTESNNRHIIDSNSLSAKGLEPHELISEHSSMPGSQVSQSDQTNTETPVTVSEQPVMPLPRKKPASSKKKQAGSAPSQAPTKAATASAAKSSSARKVFSEQERAQKLDEVVNAQRAGDSLKAAAKKAGISVQTYYHWKKPAEPAEAAQVDLNDLVALEEENKRLKKLLAERLRDENAELKRRLGLG